MCILQASKIKNKQVISSRLKILATNYTSLGNAIPCWLLQKCGLYHHIVLIHFVKEKANILSSVCMSERICTSL
jgi:hypothetical protein